MAAPSPLRIEVVGLLKDITYHMAKCCAEDLNLRDPTKFSAPVTTGMLEFEWDLYIEEKKKELQGETWVFDSAAIAFVNGGLIGGPAEFMKWAEVEHSYENFRPSALYETLAEEAYKTHLSSTNHDFVYMDVSIADKPVGKLLIELFSNLCPRTCENFRALCTGEKGESELTEYKLHYEGSIIHRITKNGWIQGGDIFMKRGDGGESIYGPVFEDENFAIKHTRRGIVGMANKGRHTNGSQFYISLQPTAWMDTKYVAFGQVIEGTETLKAIEAQNTMNERPMQEVKITACGVNTYEF